MGSSMAAMGSMLRAVARRSAAEVDFRWQQRAPCKARGILTVRPDGELPVETSGRGVRLVIKGWLFVCLFDSPYRKQNGAARLPDKSRGKRQAGPTGHVGRGRLSEKCEVERIADYGGTMRLKRSSRPGFCSARAMALLTMPRQARQGRHQDRL